MNVTIGVIVGILTQEFIKSTIGAPTITHEDRCWLSNLGKPACYIDADGLRSPLLPALDLPKTALR